MSDSVPLKCHAKTLTQPCPGRTANGHPHGGKLRGQPLCSPRPRRDEPRQPLGEDVARAPGVGAEKLQATKSPHSVQIRNVFDPHSVRTARKLRTQPILAATQEIS
jgi:hypothetical protein